MAESFADLVKNARYEELRANVGPWLKAPWTWDDLLRLLEALGVRDPDGFLASGWWLPADARVDPGRVDAYAAQAEEAIATGVIPKPGVPYAWSDVRALIEWCGIPPAAVVDGLLWAYAQTLGEDLFIDTLRRTAPSARGDRPAAGEGGEGEPGEPPGSAGPPGNPPPLKDGRGK